MTVDRHVGAMNPERRQRVVRYTRYGKPTTTLDYRKPWSAVLRGLIS